MTVRRQDIMLDVGDQRVPVVMHGEGPMLLYLHSEIEAGRPNPGIEELGVHRRIIEPVHPGFGPTQLPAWLETVDDLVIHYAELISVLGLDRVDVVGSSLGGWLALAFAAAYPERVRSLVVVDALGTRVPGVAMPDVFRLGPTTMIEAGFCDPSRVPAARWTDDGGEESVRQYHDMTAFARLTWSPYMFDPRLARRLWRIRMPALVLWGADDAITPLAHAVSLEESLADGRLSLVENCGHYPLIEQPQRSAAEVGGFLAACTEMVP